MSSVSDKPALGAFEVLRVAGPAEAEQVAGQLAAVLRQRPGPRSSATYLSLDGTQVLHCGQWAAESSRVPADSPARDLLRDMSGAPDGGSARSWHGALAVSIDGAAAAQPPGMAVLAVRHVAGPAAARELGQLLLASGEWKRGIAGFIGATAYISADGRQFINYVRWVDEPAYDAYMADPRIAEGQPAIAGAEAAKPEFIRGRSMIA